MLNSFVTRYEQLIFNTPLIIHDIYSHLKTISHELYVDLNDIYRMMLLLLFFISLMN